ncbi:hypothetical protein [uncultured Croceitalea sp.]|uniref:hypothetical protein n=1 Tax=uncultured Croceitalea sp. TaxID=1798908 RepID=UPI0033061F0F
MKKNHDNKFKTPEGYFETFNERLMDKIAKEETVIPKTDGFVVPKGYFITIHENVINKQDGFIPKVISLRSYRKIYYAAASVAALLVIVLFFDQNKEDTIQFDDLASAEINAYFETTEFGLTSYEIAQVVALEENELTSLRNESFEEDELIEYLDSNMDTFEELDLEYEIGEDSLPTDDMFDSENNAKNEQE